MIPTQHKDKLPRHLSYPIGAESLTKGLVEAPHAESFSVTFSATPFWPRSRFKQALALLEPYTVFAAEHRPSRKPGYGRSEFFCEEKWSLTVFPVVREVRHLAHRLIQEQGIPSVVRWLRSTERAGWLTRDHRIDIMFDPVGETVSVNEINGV